jgi:CHAD domain-containing protein
MAGITRRALPKAAVKPPGAASEIEAKYAVPDHSSFEKLRALEALGEYRLVPRAEQRVTDHYLDTQRRALLEAGYACRRRADEAGGPEWVTVKELGDALEAVHRRIELETQVPPGSPPERWPEGPARDLVIRLAGEAPLVELFHLSQSRLMRDVEREGRRVAVLSLDRVEFGATLPATYELEIELAPAGDAGDLEALVAALEPFGLNPQTLSKFERALALADSAEPWTPAAPERRDGEPASNPAPKKGAGAGAKPRRKARGVALAPDDSMAEAGRKILRFHWEQALAHEAGTIAGEDPEQLHDMRVATRRQRAALRIVEPHFRGKAIRPVREGLRTLGGCLGAVRDLDVLLIAARAHQAALDPAEARSFQGLIDAWTRRDGAARRAMLAHLRGPEYARFKEGYTKFLDTPGAGARARDDEAVRRPTQVAHVLPAEIWAHFGAVLAYAASLPGARVEALHALRIEGKRLRYLLEFFRSVLDGCVEEAIEAIVAFQDHLGELQDAVVTMGLVREFLSSPDAVAMPGAAAAAARYLESRQVRIDELRRGLDGPWARVAWLKPCLSRAVAKL